MILEKRDIHDPATIVITYLTYIVRKHKTRGVCLVPETDAIIAEFSEWGEMMISNGNIITLDLDLILNPDGTSRLYYSFQLYTGWSCRDQILYFPRSIK